MKFGKFIYVTLQFGMEYWNEYEVGDFAQRDLLGGILGKASTDAKAEPGNPLNDILGGLLGGGNSSSGGNPLNDLLGGLMGGDSSKKPEEGGLGGLLGGLFGK